MGQGVGLSWFDLEKWKDIWMLRQGAHQEILPVRECYISYWWPIKWHGHAQTCRNSLYSYSHLWHWSNSCCKPWWASTTKGCIQFTFPKNIWISVVWERDSITKVPIPTNLGGTGRWASFSIYSKTSFRKPSYSGAILAVVMWNVFFFSFAFLFIDCCDNPLNYTNLCEYKR